MDMTHSAEILQRLDRLESELAIQRLVHEYCHGADKRDRARFAAIWTDDAVWQVGEDQAFEGVEAICEAVAWQWRTFEQMYHWTSNLVVTVNGDHAAGETDVGVTIGFSDGRWLRGGGIYRDQYLRTATGWRISRREAQHLFALDQTVPAATASMETP
jgi:ketosteroid isomerase-like protein